MNPNPNPDPNPGPNPGPNPNPNPYPNQDYMFSGRSGETLIKLPGEIGGQQFIIERCTDCDI